MTINTDTAEIKTAKSKMSRELSRVSDWEKSFANKGYAKFWNFESAIIMLDISYSCKEY